MTAGEGSGGAELTSEVAALRGAIVELGLAQAEALIALSEFTKTGGPPGGPTRNATAAAVSDAAGRMLAIVQRLGNLNDG